MNWYPGPRFNIKMTFYWYRKSHCGDKTILRPSYLHNGISYTGKTTSLYWIGALMTYRRWWWRDTGVSRGPTFHGILNEDESTGWTGHHQGVSRTGHSTVEAGLSWNPWWRHQMETFSCYWPFVRGIHRPPVTSPHNGQCRGALMFLWTNDWVNNGDAGDLRHHHAQYDHIVIHNGVITTPLLGKTTGHRWIPRTQGQ